MENNRVVIVKAGIILAILTVIFSVGLFLSLPIFNKIFGASDLRVFENYQPVGSVEIYDYKDEFVGVLQGEEDRQVVKINQISENLIQAVLAAEDSNFFKHNGFSLSSVFRASIVNLKAGRVVQGGSTITQQMVKNLFIKEDQRYKRSFMRKIKELLIALEVEKKYSKEKILEIYLNQVYFGKRAYGIERAAQRYFSKTAKELNVSESSYLAGLLTAPSYLGENYDKARERQLYVLDKMLNNGFISKEEHAKAKKTNVKFNYASGNLALFPYYFSLIEKELAKRYTEHEINSMGLKVYTGIDPVAQRIAERILNTGVRNAASGIDQGAIVTIDVQTGEVRALVGGVGNFFENQFDRASNPHTLGSAFKPFVYLTAFIMGSVDPSTIIQDEEIRIRDYSADDGYWIPQNFDHEFHGPLTVKAALVFSRNIPAIKVAQKAGMSNIIQTAENAGIKSKMQNLLSLALGSQAFSPFEVATAYATFARGGTYIEPIVIRKIVDNQKNTLEVNTSKPQRTLPEIHVSQLVSILEEVVNVGTGTLAKIPNRTMAGKTGTADGSRDIWFIGFTPEYSTAVWCGNDLNKKVDSTYATGGSTPAWIWKEYMTEYYQAKPRAPSGFAFGNGYKIVAIDPLTGLLATDYTPNPVYKRFIPGTEPKDYAPTPDVGKIKEREEKPFLKFKEGLSQEDKDLRSANDTKNENDDKERAVPKPKKFTISTKKDKEPEAGEAKTESTPAEASPVKEAPVAE
jgi:1A family penicillin-binding protein